MDSVIFSSNMQDRVLIAIVRATHFSWGEFDIIK